MSLKFSSRAETGAASNLDVIPKIYVREIADNGAVGAWDSGTALTALTMGSSNEFFQFDYLALDLVNDLSIGVGAMVQIELTRDAGAVGDTLTGDWSLLTVEVGFI